MGIRKIEDEIDLKEAMKKKAAELQIKDLQAKASVENFTNNLCLFLSHRISPILRFIRWSFTSDPIRSSSSSLSIIAS